MDINEKLAGAVVTIYFIWLGILPILHGLLRIFQSHYLFRSGKYSKFDGIYKYIYQKKYNEKDKIYISKLRVKLNTYISKYKYNNKSSLDTIITVIITTLTTLTITSYNIQSQSNKELVTLIVKNLGNDFATAVFIVLIVYGIKGIINEFVKNKFEYYLMIKNIIDEVEKEKSIEMQKEIEKDKQEENEQVILKLKEIQDLLKCGNEDKGIIKKACNKIINDIF